MLCVLHRNSGKRGNALEGPVGIVVLLADPFRDTDTCIKKLAYEQQLSYKE